MKIGYPSLLLCLCLPIFVFGFSDKEPGGKRPLPGKNAIYTNVYDGVNYSSSHPYNLNVIYFLPNDVPLDPTYKKRLSEMLLYTQEFYRQNMVFNGYGSKTFGLFTETANPDNVKVILVNGSLGAASYPKGNSLEAAEVNAYFAANPAQKTSESILLYTAISDIDNFNAPDEYTVGRTAYAVDYTLLDLKYLDPLESEYLHFCRKMGEMVHELGHALNLEHSESTNTEKADPTKGTSLMGNGSNTFGHAPTWINRAGCAVLDNCEVLADAPGIFYNGHSTRIRTLQSTFNNGNLEVTGTFLSDKTVTAVNFFQQSILDDEHARPTWSVNPVGDGFSVSMAFSDLPTDPPGINDGAYTLLIELVLANGETVMQHYDFNYINGEPDVNIEVTDIANCTGGSAAGCPARDTVAGYALEFYGYPIISLPASIPTTNTFTVTAWIKPKGIQPDQAGIMSFGNGYFYLGQNGDNQLGYVWNSTDASNSFSSNLFVPADKWSFVAMVVHPDSTVLYLNNQSATDASPQAAMTVSGGYFGNSSAGAGFYKGKMDEVTLWKRALSTNELDSMRHLTKEKIADKASAAYDPSLVAYYQFNDALATKTYNQVDSSIVYFDGSVIKNESTAPVGSGTSARATITAAGSYSFGHTGITMNFINPSTYPGTVWVTKINTPPDSLPAGYAHTSPNYWIINRKGFNIPVPIINPPTIQFSNVSISAADAAVPSVLKLLTRAPEEGLNNWSSPSCGALAATAGSSATATFNSICGNYPYSQLLLATTGTSILPVTLLSFTGVKTSSATFLQWRVAAEISLAYYQVERSTDGVNFALAGKAVKAGGINAYSQYDAQPVAGINYYRLKMVNNDGSFKYSNIITVKWATVNFITFAPNPVTSNSPLTIANNDANTAYVSLYTADGRLFKQLVIAPHNKGTVTNLHVGLITYKAFTIQGNTASGIEIVQ